MIALVILLAAGWLAGGLFIIHLLTERNESTERESLLREANENLIQASQKLFEAAQDKPRCDCFLEIGDLKNKLAEQTAGADALNIFNIAANNALAAERRSNAALRGQITKLTQKKKVKA